MAKRQFSSSLAFSLGLMMGLLLGVDGNRRACAHGDIHLQIVAVTESIAQDTNNASLYLKRGELYRFHQNYDAAHLDLVTAAQLSTNQFSAVHLALARLYLDVGWPLSCKATVETFLRMEPDHVEGLNIRAQALIQLEDPLAAAADFGRAIAHSLAPGPELFIDRARAFALAGEDYIDEAISSLDDGIKTLGPLVTLQLPAIDYELDRRHYDMALQRLDSLAAQSPRKESWLKRRGEILLEAGRKDEARAAFQKALQALDALPPSRRHVPAMADLEQKLRTQLDLLTTPTPTNTEKGTAP